MKTIEGANFNCIDKLAALAKSFVHDLRKFDSQKSSIGFASIGFC
jgi:hypothetical protein